MITRCLLLALATLLFPTAAAADDAATRRLFWSGFACSVATDIGDLASTVYAHDRRADVVEGNPIYGDSFSVGDLTIPIIVKSIGAAAVNGTAYLFYRRGRGVWGSLLVWGNCALKGIFIVHNLRVANDVPEPPTTGAGVQVTWRLRLPSTH